MEQARHGKFIADPRLQEAMKTCFQAFPHVETTSYDQSAKLQTLSASDRRLCLLGYAAPAADDLSMPTTLLLSLAMLMKALDPAAIAAVNGAVIRHPACAVTLALSVASMAQTLRARLRTLVVVPGSAKLHTCRRSLEDLPDLSSLLLLLLMRPLSSTRMRRRRRGSRRRWRRARHNWRRWESAPHSFSLAHSLLDSFPQRASGVPHRFNPPGTLLFVANDHPTERFRRCSRVSCHSTLFGLEEVAHGDVERHVVVVSGVAEMLFGLRDALLLDSACDRVRQHKRAQLLQEYPDRRYGYVFNLRVRDLDGHALEDLDILES